MKLVVGMNAARGLLFVLSLAASAALVGEASAQSCLAGCNSVRKGCVQSARAARVGCRLDCRENAPADEKSTCRRGCRDAYAEAKAVCTSDRADCRGTCSDQGNNAACPGQCGQAQGQCMRDVAATHHDCIGSCEPGPGRGPCNQDCGTAADDGRAACKASYDACIAACGGSPSGAFLDALP
jgi:hypothetical protein